MRVAWSSDIHLNFLAEADQDAFLARVNRLELDAWLVSGDISEAPTLLAHLDKMDHLVEAPTFIILGNHDFYRDRVSEVRAKVRSHTAASKKCKWLPGAGVVPLSDRTALVGQDGWADGRAGDYAASSLRMTDFDLIGDLAGLDKWGRLARMRSWADEAAEALGQDLARACRDFPHLIALTHVPPFPEACATDGRVWRDDWLPYFVALSIGQAMRECMARHPQNDLLVLCGHTHREADCQILPNLRVRTAPAEYRAPAIVDILDIR